MADSDDAENSTFPWTSYSTQWIYTLILS